MTEQELLFVDCEPGTRDAATQKLQLECARVVRDVEARVEKFMTVTEGEPPLWLGDGVKSVLLGCVDGKSVEIQIHVQPGMGDPYWSS